VALITRTARAVFALCAVFIVGVLDAPAASAQAQAAAVHNGAGDFDWEIGLWDTNVRVRAPLDATAAWTEYNGTSNVHAFSNGRANLVELSVANASGGRIEGVSLRLYDPQAGQWGLNYASMRNGELTAPVYGAFANGQGVFYGQDVVDGRVVLVRFVISDITANSARFVQSYSADGAQTWIDNWIALDTRRR
jgi:hypothetical protein